MNVREEGREVQKLQIHWQVFSKDLTQQRHETSENYLVSAKRPSTFLDDLRLSVYSMPGAISRTVAFQLYYRLSMPY